MSNIQTPIPRRATSDNLDELDTTQHGDRSRSTRNRLPVSVPRNPPPEIRLLGRRVRGATPGPKTSNTHTQMATAKIIPGGKRKKRKTQKKRKSTKKRNKKKKQ